MKKNKILIIVFKGIGDIVLTTPLVKALKELNKENEIYFLTKKFAAPILEKNPYISKIFIREEKPLMEIISSRPNIVFDFMLSSSSLAYSLFSLASKRITFHRPWNAVFYSHRIKTDFEGYTVIKRLELLRALGIDPAKFSSTMPEVYISQDEKEHIRSILKEKGLSANDKIASFDITSPRIYRQLPGDKFIALADYLSELGYKIIFHPGPGEETYVKENLSRAREKHTILEGLNLRELSALISFSSLHIGTSSAPMHIAVSFNIPTFTVYSPFTSPSSWSPNLPIHGFIQGDLDKLQFEEIKKELSSFLERNGL